jgi:hypothetical protein
MKPERSEQYKEQKYLEHRQSLVSKILFKAKRNGVGISRHVFTAAPSDHHFTFYKYFLKNFNFSEVEYTLNFPYREMTFREDLTLIQYRGVRKDFCHYIKEKRQFDCFRKLREILHASHDGSDVLVAGLEKLQLYCNFKNET